MHSGHAQWSPWGVGFDLHASDGGSSRVDFADAGVLAFTGPVVRDGLASACSGKHLGTRVVAAAQAAPEKKGKVRWLCLR